MQLFTALLTALALVSLTTASPAPAAIRRSEDIVFSPTVLTPKEGTSWQVGTKLLVTWDSTIPQGGEKNTGTIVLGFDNGTGSENLDYEHPLASGFLLSSGSQNVTVPDVPLRSTYYVVLFGDSTNKSPNFTIHH